MAKARSDKSKYKSPSTGDYVTCGQYIAEILCTRQAEKEGGKPAYKFWSTQKWEKIYRRQVTDAYKFIKEFGEEAVVTFIKSNEGKMVFSFGFPNLKDKIKATKIALERQAEIAALKKEVIADEEPPFDVTPTPQSFPALPTRPSYGKQSLASKLKKAEKNGEEEGRSSDVGDQERHT